MTDLYFCPATELSVHKGDTTVHPIQIRDLKVQDLLEHRVRAFGLPVQIERVGEEIRFEFKGADMNRRYHPEAPAEELLNGIVRLGEFYNKDSGLLFF